MQFSERWLRAYVDPKLSSTELADALTMAGLEVEEVEPVAPPFSGVVVARVKSTAKHPNADKLTVCEVDVGAGRLLNIVCGAPNVAAGMLVPCALEGALLPGDLHIRATTMRGVASQGMLCSARELGIAEDASGLLALPENCEVGQDIRAALALDDQRFTIKLTPNRGDCLSLLGVAREVAAITGAPLRAPQFKAIAPTLTERLPVRIEAPDLCGRFSGRVIRGVNARAATPEWMKQRLERSGQRSISALVDISNYVMLELGRPSHVFDLSKVKGGLVVRWARAGESVELLNGQTVELDPWFGVIADDGGVEALAGVMGGEATAVTLDTTDIYVEAAFWWPESIQGRARRLNFGTDAAHRFERGVDFATTVEHIEYITQLVSDICGTSQTKLGPVDDQVARLPQREPVRMRIERCRKVLGVALQADEMAQIFQRLGLRAERRADAFEVTPPSYRFDLEIEEDLIEEVARLWGFARIPAHPPRVPAVMRAPDEATRSAHAIRQQLAAAGYQELINYSFVDAASEEDFARSKPIRVLNPIASQMAVMRTSLIGGLVGALSYNIKRKVQRARLFELGRVFRRSAAVADGPLAVEGIEQPTLVAGIAFGSASNENWAAEKRDVDFYDMKGDVEALLAGKSVRFISTQHPALHPGRSAAIECNGVVVGHLGELHPRWQLKYELPRPAVLFELDIAVLTQTELPRVEPVPRFPAVLRDIALWVDAGVPVQRIFDAVSELMQQDARLRILREFRLFDVYRAAADSSSAVGASANALLNKEKSLAFRMVLQDTERTLSDADADAAKAALVEGLRDRVGARLR